MADDILRNGRDQDRSEPRLSTSAEADLAAVRKEFIRRFMNTDDEHEANPDKSGEVDPARPRSAPKLEADQIDNVASAALLQILTLADHNSGIQMDRQHVEGSVSWRLCSFLYRIERRTGRKGRRLASIFAAAFRFLTFRPRAAYSTFYGSQSRLMEDRAALVNSPLFAGDWYCEAYPDAKTFAGGALEHFLIFGADEGRNPNPFFSTSWYLAHNPDVVRSRRNPLAHFVLYGNAENRQPHPLFDAVFYQATNPDIAETSLTAFEHFVTIGAHEGRPTHNLTTYLDDPVSVFSGLT